MGKLNICLKKICYFNTLTPIYIMNFFYYIYLKKKFNSNYLIVKRLEFFLKKY